MIVTETLQSTGRFTLGLRDDTPATVWRDIQEAIESYDASTDRRDTVLDGQVFVFPTRTNCPTPTTAIYAGQLLNVEDHLSFSGQHLAAYMARQNGIGRHVPAPIQFGTQTLSTLLVQVLPTNGITTGTITSTGLPSATAEWKVGQSLREFIDEFCSTIGAEWRVNPDGTLDAGPAATLFDADQVVVMPNPGSASGHPRGIAGSPTSQRIYAQDTADHVLAAGSGLGDQMAVATATATAARGYGFDGTRGEFWAVVDAAGSDLAAVTAAAAGSINLRAAPRDSFGIAVDDATCRQFVAPGDVILVWAPRRGIDGGGHVAIDGQNARPIRARVTSMTWSRPPTWGVWLRRHSGTVRWVDLTAWIAPADQQTTLSVSTGRGAIDWAAEPGVAARLGTTELLL